MLQSVEGHDANWIIELPGHKIFDDSFQIGPLGLDLAVDADAIKAINDPATKKLWRFRLAQTALVFAETFRDIAGRRSTHRNAHSWRTNSS